MSGVRRPLIIFEDCGLAGPIVADDGDALAAFYLKVQIREECHAVETLGKLTDGENVISAGDAWFQRNVHRVVDFGRFFQKIHLGKHFFTALGALDGFLTVKGFEFGDNLLLMADLLLLV